MADTVQFDLVSPERKLASLVASEVQIPGAEGDLTAMAGHEPTILTLRPGILTVVSAAGEEQYVVTGGFAEISVNTISVLAEIALPRGEVTPEILTDLVAAAAAASEATAQPETQKVLADLMQVAETLGMNVNA